MKAKLIKFLKAEHIREDYGCECHSVEKLADEIMKVMEVENE